MHYRSLFVLFAIFLQGCRAQTCTDYDLRLVGGQVPNEGRVEICVNQQWGTVCDDLWGDPDAEVVCRQLGYPTINASSFRQAHFGEGSGETFLDNVRCSGSESRLIDCDHPPVGDENCDHFEDAGVRCVPPQCHNGEIRLVGGAVDWEGRVEVCINNDWNTVCDDGWDASDAGVACRQLGYSRHNAVTYERAHFGQGNGPIGLDDVACSGAERQLVNCSYDGNTSDCKHLEDAGVRCQPELLCEDGSIRVMDGLTAYEGRVEVCFDEAWGTVCNNNWEDIDASVACNQLGFSSQNAVAYLHPGLATYSQGTGSILLNSVGCNGTESRLANCAYNSDTTDCSHNEDAGIRCQSQDPCRPGDIRLAGSSIPGRGRVEVCVNGLWGTVCDDGWGSTDASVVCKQLNYSRHNATALSRAHFGPGSLPILMRNVGCSGSEEKLTNCPFSSQAASCSHSEDAGVQCQIEPICQNGDIRITGAMTNETIIAGRVEICFNETWGTVCSDDWNSDNAIVACRQLGYSTQGAVALTTPGVSGYSQGSGPIFLDNTVCDGTESRLIDCDYDIHTADCSHLQDAGVQCEFLCQTGSIRLVGGQTRREGRVEVCVNQMWGTVCDDDWDAVDASVVCMQLGYSPTNATAYMGARFGEGMVPTFLDNVACQGPETRLIDCAYDGHTTDCSHSEDASVQCQPLCQNGDIRLVGGGSQREGRVEVCMDGGWGTVCADDLWDATDATVVCTQLGFSRYGAEALYGATFGQGTVPVIMTNVMCSGAESQLAGCTHDGVPVQGYFHSKDAGVRCQIPADGPTITLYLRTSAKSMRLSWQPLTPEERGGVVSMYHVKYRPLGGVIRQSLDDMSVVINTTDVEVTITDLDPRVTYAVAVAASTSAGVGNYSEEVVVGLYSNSLFQLHLTGAVICQEWLLNTGPLEILDDISQDTARELDGICRCSLSAKFIGDGRLHCDSNRTDAVVLQARMISTKTRDSSGILSTLQEWAHTSPTLVARGVQLMVRADCSVELEEFDSSVGCVQLPTTPPSTQAPMTPESPTTPTMTPQQPGPTNPGQQSSIPIPAIAGAVGAVLAVVVIVLLAVIVSRKLISKEKIHHAEGLDHTTIVNPWNPKVLTEQPAIPTVAVIAAEPREAAGSALETMATNEPHVYETIPGESDKPPAIKYENQPTHMPQDSSVRTNKTNSGYDYVTNVRCGTVLPEEASASSQANGHFVSEKPQKASNGGQECVRLDVDSFPPLQSSTFGPGGTVPNSNAEMTTHANPAYGLFGNSSGPTSIQDTN